MRSVALHGRALHSGATACVTLTRLEGPVALRQGRAAACLADLRVVRADHGVCVEGDGGLRVDLVEHLFGALAGLGVESGLQIAVRGPELPLLDGGARLFAAALLALGLGGEAPALRVVRRATYRVDESTYELSPGASRLLEVDVEYPGGGRQRASWDGTPAGFVGEIAAARTFGWRRDAERLRAAGRAAHVEPGSVLVLEEDGTPSPGFDPPGVDELARHKLLDLLGDLQLHGGAPAGVLRASRPGHRATHAAVRQALTEGVLASALEPAGGGR